MAGGSKIIKGAAYYWINDWPTKESTIRCLPNGFTHESTTASFYDCDGNFLTDVSYASMPELMDSGLTERLDPSAPKTKCASYRLIWWPAFRLGGGLVKGMPGYAVLYHDKHGHRFDWERVTNPEVWKSNLDLTDAIQEPADYTYRPSVVDVPETSSWCTIL